MNSGTYSCLKMLEILHAEAVSFWNAENWESADNMGGEYNRIRQLLSKYLSKDELEFIPEVGIHRYGPTDSEYLQKVITASDVAVTYLRSLDMNLDKELLKKKEELSTKEKDLELKEREIESLRKLLTKSLEATNQIPELLRSKIVEETKKSHREIERNSRK